MQKRTYNRISATCLMGSVSAVLLYDLGGYTWIGLSLALLTMTIVATSYFVYRFYAASSIEVELKESLTHSMMRDAIDSVSAVIEAGESERSVEVHGTLAPTRLEEALTRRHSAAKLQTGAYALVRARRDYMLVLLHHEKTMKEKETLLQSEAAMDVSSLLRNLASDKFDFGRTPRFGREIHPTSRGHLRLVGSRSQSGKKSTGTKVSVYKQGVGRKVDWTSLAVGEEFTEETVERKRTR